MSRDVLYSMQSHDQIFLLKNSLRLYLHCPSPLLFPPSKLSATPPSSLSNSQSFLLIDCFHIGVCIRKCIYMPKYRYTTCSSGGMLVVYIFSLLWVQPHPFLFLFSSVVPLYKDTYVQLWFLIELYFHLISSNNYL